MTDDNPYDVPYCCGKLSYRKPYSQTDRRIVCLECGRIIFEDGAEGQCSPDILDGWKHLAQKTGWPSYS